MDRFRTVLRRYEARALKESATIAAMSPVELLTRRDEFLVSIGSDAGEFLHAFIRAVRPECILELGTSYGYSTLWLTHAAHLCGGRVVTIEAELNKVEYARTQLAAAGLGSSVRVVHGDVFAVLKTLDVTWDLVLLDLWKDVYVKCFDLVFPAVRPGGFIVADNMITPVATRRAAASYRAHVRRSPCAESLLVPVGNGLEVTRRTSRTRE